MDLSYSDEQQFLQEAVRGVIDREAPLSRVRDWVLGETVDHGPALELAVRQGWTGIGIDEEHGGQGGGLLELTILAEELGRGAVPADALYASLLSALLLAGAEGEDAAGLAREAAEDGVPLALAVGAAGPLDVGAGDDTSPVPLVLGAPQATRLLRVGATGIDVHDASDCAVVARRMLDRTRGLADVTLGSSATTLPAPRDGALGDLAAWSAVIVAADALGACQRMLDLTVQYVGERVQFGVPVGSFQAVKHAAAEMLVAIEGTRAAVQYAAWAAGAGQDGAATDAWVAKSRAARAAAFVADKALFLHGAVGYTWEHDLQLLFKRAKSDAELLGGAGVYEDRIADTLALT